MSEKRIIQVDRDELESVVSSIVERSHQAVAQVQSNGFGGVDKRLALIEQSVRNIEMGNVERNGKFAKAIDAFSTKFSIMDTQLDDLKTSRSYATGAIAVIMIAVVPILSWSVYEIVELIRITSK